MLTRNRSSFSPPDGKLSPDIFDFHFEYPSQCMWIVALDGSELSFQALRLVTFLMNPKHVLKGIHDNVVVVTVLKRGESEASKHHILNDARVELIKCGVGDFNISTKAITLPDGWEVGDALVYFANHAHIGRSASGHFVLGAQGMDKASIGQSKMAHLGSIAEQCLAKIKTPVTIVKNAWGTKLSDRDALGRPIRAGYDATAKSGLHIVCAVDGTPTSDAAFDLATSLCREGDTLTAVYVTGSSDQRAILCESNYTIECAKVGESRKLKLCEFVKVVLGKGGSVAKALVEIGKECDVLVMGSVEMTKIAKRHVLGSVAMGIAKHAPCHLCVAKNYA